jgi:hypothetical protein
MVGEKRVVSQKIIDAISAVSVAIFLGIAVKFVVWGETPRPPGHLSIDSKIVVWNLVPLLFGSMWLLVRYANTLRDKFQSVFGSWWKLAFSGCVFGLAFFLHHLASLGALLFR